MRRFTKIRVFVASPADVSAERDALTGVVEELNRTLGETEGVVIDLIRWETHARPGLGEDAQDVINKQIKEYDIFVGILWARIGTPTRRAISGTVEEFKRARAHFKTLQQPPRILFYFNQAPIELYATADLAQARAVLNFRASLDKDGAFYREYESTVVFAQMVREHLYGEVVSATREAEAADATRDSPATPPTRTTAGREPRTS